MATLAIGIFAALLFVLNLAQFIEIRALRRAVLVPLADLARAKSEEVRLRHEIATVDAGSKLEGHGAPAPASADAGSELEGQGAPARASESASAVDEPEDDEGATRVWTGPPAALLEAAASEAEAGDAHRQPQAALSVASSVAVAPPASASLPPRSLFRLTELAAELGRSKSERPPPHALPVRVRTATLAGVPSPLREAPPRTLTTMRPPAGPAPVVAAPRCAPTLISMQAQSGAQRLADDDGETTSALASSPPMYAQRPIPAAVPRAPLADPDLIGSEDRADEAACVRLGPDEQTPPRRVRASIRMPVFEAPERGT